MYLSGIEIKKRQPHVHELYPPNCTLVELKSVRLPSTECMPKPPNCTLVELKLEALGNTQAWLEVSKLYLSGIEIYLLNIFKAKS